MVKSKELPRRTQADRRAASSAVLLRSAAELIAERGLERASLRSIGERAGTSREMPAYHFGSKAALVNEISARAHERTLQATRDALARTGRRVEDLTALETLRVTIETYLEVFAGADAPEERAVVVMWGATFPTDSPVPAIVEDDRRTQQDLAGLIRQGQRDGSVRGDVDADAAATVVFGTARGIAAASLVHAADTNLIKAMSGQLVECLLAARPHGTSQDLPPSDRPGEP
jgi:AcrR family transcriptional regulator